MFSLKVANILKLEAILFMLIRWSKRQNSAWEQGKSNSAYPNYSQKAGSQRLLRNASRLLHRPLFHKWSNLFWIPPLFTFNAGQSYVSLRVHCTYMTTYIYYFHTPTLIPTDSIAVNMDRKKCGTFSPFGWLSPDIYDINILRNPNEVAVQ